MHTVKSSKYPKIAQIEWDREAARAAVNAKLRHEFTDGEPYGMCDFFEFRRELDDLATGFVEYALPRIP